MINVMDYPLLVFVLSFFSLWLSTLVGSSWLRRWRAPAEDTHGDIDIILAASLTLLGLIIGFTFSMATNRYDQRKNYEAEEANAIGTEYVRAGLLPAADGARVRALLRDYVDQRVLFYLTRDPKDVRQINARTARMQGELWGTLRAPAAAQPTPIMQLVVSGMNDVLNTQGYTQAAYWNRIPTAAWILMAAIAICCNLLVGYRARKPRMNGPLLMVLPLVVSIAFFLIADIDSPHGGVIRVEPLNLESLAESMRGP